MSRDAVCGEKLTKKYGFRFALNDCSFRLPAQRVTGVLGPNGAGKSTLFRMITGMANPDRGRLEVLGQAPGWQTNRDIAYLPDRASWFPEQTVADALNWGEHLLPGFSRERANALMEFMKLDPEMRASGMSKGQEARLMLAVCLARDVPLLVLDEPFSGIDLISRERIIEALIDNLSEREQTVLISTHEIAEAESLFDHVVFLDEGQVVLAGDAEQLRADRGSIEAIYRKLYR